MGYFDSWYDYLPGVNTVQALRAGYSKFKGNIDEQKQGDLTAAAQSKALGDNLYSESMGGLGKAEGYYAPAQAMLKNAYGDPGTMTGGPSQYPVAPARAK